MDGIGSQHGDARAFSDAYFERGCLANAGGFEGTWTPISAINQHAVFDSARRWSQWIRMIPRQQLVGYSVEDGKSILWFRRDAVAVGGVESWLQVYYGDVQAGKLYEVRGGSTPVDYVEYPVGSAQIYTNGQRFTGQAGESGVDIGGDCTVWRLLPGALAARPGQDFWDGIADRIAHTAPPRGWTNEWLIDFQFHAYHPSESSLWKPGAFSDYFPFVNRCHFYSGDLAGDDPLLWHTSYGQSDGTGVLSPEVPSGWNYVRKSSGAHANQITVPTAKFPDNAAKRAFYKSCRIYEPPAEIESAETVEEDGETRVKVTLTGRLHSTTGEVGGAPDSIGRDMSTWTGATIAAEPFRTSENAIRLYLLHATTGVNFSMTYGDDAAGSGVSGLPDNPYASIYPLVQLVRMVPEPYSDGNDRQGSPDTPLWADTFGQMETYLRAMCEGAIDEDSTFAENNCAVDAAYWDCTLEDFGLYDYTFESLCLSAFGGRWIGCAAEADRPDKPFGVGPMPNTALIAEVFNRFSACLDKLTHYRLMVPWSITTGYQLYSGLATELGESAGSGCGSQACGPAARFAVVGRAEPATAAGASGDDASILAYTTSSLGGLCSGPGGLSGNWLLAASRRTASYALAPTDPDIVDALPPIVRSLVEIDAAVATLCCYTAGTQYFRTGTRPACGADVGGCNFEGVQDFATRCVWVGTGALDCGPLAPSGWHFIDKANPTCAGGPGLWQFLRPLASLEGVLVVPLEDQEVGS